MGTNVLRERIRELEEENAKLREKLEAKISEKVKGIFKKEKK